jgi:hypothetical protein
VLETVVMAHALLDSVFVGLSAADDAMALTAADLKAAADYVEQPEKTRDQVLKEVLESIAESARSVDRMLSSIPRPVVRGHAGAPPKGQRRKRG